MCCAQQTVRTEWISGANSSASSGLRRICVGGNFAHKSLTSWNYPQFSLLLGENRRYLSHTRPSLPDQYKAPTTTPPHTPSSTIGPSCRWIPINRDYDCAHKRHVATLECNTLYLLIRPMREDPDARFGHVLHIPSLRQYLPTFHWRQIKPSFPPELHIPPAF